LQNLAHFISHFTGATGVYIGRLKPPTRTVDDSADDNAHIIDDQSKVIKYIHTTENHSFMLNKTLTVAKGPITHSVFDAVPPAPPVDEQAEGD